MLFHRMVARILAVIASLLRIAASSTLHIVNTSPTNDLYGRLTARPQPFTVARHGNLSAALVACSRGDSLALLADGPSMQTGIQLNAADFVAIDAAGLSGVFIEMPSTLPRFAGAFPAPAQLSYFDRLVVVARSQVKGLFTGEILAVNSAFAINMTSSGCDGSSTSTCDVIATLGIVAGSSTAVFGAPALNVSIPALAAMELNDGGTLLVSAFTMSTFIHSRYGPAQAWNALLTYIVATITAVPSFDGIVGWRPRLRPTLGANETLARATAIKASGAPVPQPADYETAAVIRATDWLASPTSGMIVVGDNATCQAPHWPAAGVGSPPLLACVLEGIESSINQIDGSQMSAATVRADCNAEVGMAIALRALLEATQPLLHVDRVPSTDSMSSHVEMPSESLEQLQQQQQQQQQQRQILQQRPRRSDDKPTSHESAVDWPVLAAAIMNYTFRFSAAQQGNARGNSSSTAFGIVSWYATPETTDEGWSQYGDDNARVLDAAIVACSALRSPVFFDRFNADCDAIELGVIKSLLGNLRTTSHSGGFRWGRMNGPDFDRDWKIYWDANLTYESDPVYPMPHYQAQLWATFLWAYAKTGWAPFYDMVVVALESTMADYHNSSVWSTTEYMSEEQTRLAFTLAWLLRAETSPAHAPAGVNATHADWLIAVMGDYIATQDASGGVMETLGNVTESYSPPPSSNDRYGTGEAPLIQETGDTITDQLYSQNYAIVALMEAAAALRTCANNSACNATVPSASQQARHFQLSGDLLASYLCAIQAVVAPADSPLAYLNGTWPRAFDFSPDTWDYWGSSSDSGWGPWSVETGWTMTWISSSLALRGLRTSFWDFTVANTGITAGRVADACAAFFPDEFCSYSGRLLAR